MRLPFIPSHISTKDALGRRTAAPRLKFYRYNFLIVPSTFVLFSSEACARHIDREDLLYSILIGVTFFLKDLYKFFLDLLYGLRGRSMKI